MRRMLAFVVALMLVALSAAGFQAPASTHAAPALDDQITITGRLVAAPQNTTPPANLLLQVNNQTILVQVSAQTRIVDRNYNLITLADLRDRAVLRVTGSYNGPQFFATQIRDLSLRTTVNLQLTAVLDTVPNSGLLCVNSVTITGVSTPKAQALTVSPCPASDLPIYLTNRTKIVDQSGLRAHVTDLKSGDKLTIAASLINTQTIASQVQDTSLSVPIALQVQGRLESMPSAGLLCLLDVKFNVTNAPRSQAQPVSPCPDPNAFPVYLTSTTKFQDKYGGTASLGDLKINDMLLAAGPLLNGQFTPTVVRDLSLQTGLATLTGKLVGTPQNASLPTNLLLQVGAQTILVTVDNSTTIVNRDSTPIALTDLQNGNTLVVRGTYNGAQIAAASIRDLSLPAQTEITVKGQLAAAPNPATVPPSGFLCLANSVVTGVSAPRAQAQIASVCPSGQLPVYLNSATMLEDHTGGPITLMQFKATDSLYVKGNLVDGQLIATVVIDYSV